MVLLLDTGEVIAAEETCCLSQSNYGQLDVPENLTDITHIYAEGHRSGALDSSGRLHLWGWDSFGVYEGWLNAVPPQLGKISRADIQGWSTYAHVMFTDCDNDGIHDPQACYDGTVADTNENYVPDACEFAEGDFNLDGSVDGIDLDLMLVSWGTCAPESSCIADMNGDGVVDGTDVGLFLANWTG